MATEIERKFLVCTDDWRAQATRSEWMHQGYLGGETLSIRVRMTEAAATLNMKARVAGPERAEFEYEIPRDDAHRLLHDFATAAVVKRRHYVPTGPHVFEVDEFEGENQGLIVAEIELSSVDEAFERPAWLGEEVTDELRYYNNALARHPYSQWGAQQGRQ